MIRASLFFIFLVLIMALGACRKDRFTGSASAQLRTSVDSLHFDTVFVTAGSTSDVVKIQNDNEDGIRISSVRLAGGAASPFRINVDGLPGPEVRDLELGGHDSLYIYVSVTIQPSAANQPFVVQDSIEITWNGNRLWVQLDAFGQNARFLRNHTVRGTETWDNTLPYVLLDGLTVDTTATLHIQQGTKIYSHANAPFLVNGKLVVNGDRYDSTRVIFTGDRRDDPYRDFPASWPGLQFSNVSGTSILSYVVVKNAYQGIAKTGAAQLTLNECIIDNAYDAGLLAINTSVTARNLLVSNCGQNISLIGGGQYQFTHCTAVGLSNAFQQHKEAVLFVSDADFFGRTAPLNANFRNCIFWGEANGIVHDEVIVNKQGAGIFNVSFDGVLWRQRNTPSPATINNSLNNIDPQFDSISTATHYYSFRLAAGSPAINKGGNTGTPIDLDGLQRPVGALPDLGAYERQ
jgi:hypothetical protein